MNSECMCTSKDHERIVDFYNSKLGNIKNITDNKWYLHRSK